MKHGQLFRSAERWCPIYYIESKTVIYLLCCGVDPSFKIYMLRSTHFISMCILEENSDDKISMQV